MRKGYVLIDVMSMVGVFLGSGVAGVGLPELLPEEVLGLVVDLPSNLYFQRLDAIDFTWTLFGSSFSALMKFL